LDPYLSIQYDFLLQVATASQFFISYTIRNFGALTFATIMTTRQVKYKPLYLLFIFFHLSPTTMLLIDGIFSNPFVDEVGEHHAVMCVVFPPP
jgi:hypothetical protein